MHFSLSSARAIQSAGGKVLSLNELAKKKPDGKGVRIIA
jgi:ribosomal protein L18E